MEIQMDFLTKDTLRSHSDVAGASLAPHQVPRSLRVQSNIHCCDIQHLPKWQDFGRCQNIAALGLLSNTAVLLSTQYYNIL